MTSRLARLFASVTLALTLGAIPAFGEPTAPAPDTKAVAAETPEAFLEKLKAFRPTPIDQTKRNDPAYVQKYMAELTEFRKKQGDMLLEFADKFPDHKMAPMALMAAAQSASADPAKQAALYKRLVEKYPDSPATASAKGAIRRADAIGKPFELSFNDAVSGKAVSTKDLKGKVIVVDFWATWCGPCVGEMPHMKELYSKFHDKGVEFLGVSLDNEGDGLASLKDFVAKNEIPWPQYYQGKGWESEFSKSWGINSIPALFVVDKEGNLANVEARGQLETLLPQLLAK
jgi:thiol-disulfide isomerase/thioredoxin